MKWLLYGVLLVTGCNKQADPTEKASQDQSKIEKELQTGAFEPAPLPLNYSWPPSSTASPSAQK